MRDKVLAWTWTEEEPVQEMELLDEEDGGAAVITDKTSETTSASHELSESKVHTQTDIGSSLPSMLRALSRFTGASFSANLSWKYAKSTVAFLATLASSWEITLSTEAVLSFYPRRFPFDPGGYFTWLHFIYSIISGKAMPIRERLRNKSSQGIYMYTDNIQILDLLTIYVISYAI